MRSEQGQGTIEYVAILALVAIVMAASVAGGAVLGPGIANAAMGEVRHALCAVTGQACEEVDELACVMDSTRDARRETLSVAIVQAGTGRVVLRERMSDGTQRLTVLHQGSLGLTAAAGTTTRVRIGKTRVDVGAHAQGTIAAIVGKGEVFDVRTAKEADEIIRRLRASGSSTIDIARRVLGDGAGLPSPDARVVEGGIEASAGGDLSHGETGVGAGLDVGGALGRRTDTRTGESTSYLRMHTGASAFADALLATANAQLDGDAIVSVTTDRHGRGKEISVLVGAQGQASAGTAGDLATVVGDRGVQAGARWEAEVRASLEDPAVRTAYAGWKRNPASVGATRALGRALSSHGRTDVRTYAHKVSSRSEELGGSAGMRLAVGIEEQQESVHLQSARTKPPGGLWEPRLDCVR